MFHSAAMDESVRPQSRYRAHQCWGEFDAGEIAQCFSRATSACVNCAVVALPPRSPVRT
jgi:hypothetical protein